LKDVELKKLASVLITIAIKRNQALMEEHHMDEMLITIVTFIAGICLILLVWFFILIRCLRKVGPNQVMIVYGAGGVRVITGGAHLVVPIYQHAKYFSLELMSFTVEMTQELYLAEQETYVDVEAVVLIKVRTDEPNLSSIIEQLPNEGQLTREELLRVVNENGPERSVLKAVEMFLDKSQSEREELIRVVIEGHLRGIIGQRTFNELVQEPEEITQEMFKRTTSDLDRMGLEMVSFTLKSIHHRYPVQITQTPLDTL
jgi:flotillin